MGNVFESKSFGELTGQSTWQQRWFLGNLIKAGHDVMEAKVKLPAEVAKLITAGYGKRISESATKKAVSDMISVLVGCKAVRDEADKQRAERKLRR